MTPAAAGTSGHPVLSIISLDDIIVYGVNLEDYVVKELTRQRCRSPSGVVSSDRLHEPGVRRSPLPRISARSVGYHDDPASETVRDHQVSEAALS